MGEDQHPPKSGLTSGPIYQVVDLLLIFIFLLKTVSEDLSVAVVLWRHTLPQVLRGSSEAGFDVRLYTDGITRSF